MKKDIFLLASIVLLMTGCHINDVKKTLGVYNTAPDEFMILTNDRLEIPDEVYLPNPENVKKFSTNKSSPQSTVKSALDGTSDKGKVVNNKKVEDVKLSESEALFIQNIAEGDEDIKQQIAKDNQDLQVNILTDKVSAQVVDGKKEEERIEDLKKKGEVITGQDVPSRTAQEKLNK